VKTITQTLTGSPTINTSYIYDALGNRMSMTDGLGSVTYTHNSLSQLTSETRAITGVGNFTLNYTYGLSGQLSSIMDPFGSQVGYNYDKIGRLNAITGANFASVTSYASNLQYRAWGALKSLTYGNSKTLAMGYNSNLSVSTYEVAGVMKKAYQYYDDGKLKFTQDQLTTNSKFDRLYNYDHLGRITTALSGAEARGQGPTNDRPYNETMTYDALGHLTVRELRHWDRYDATAVGTYVNNRRQGWLYDADGRLLSGSSDYTYDAAGQIATFGDYEFKTDQQFDGDGRSIKSLQRHLDENTPNWITDKITYYINSSVIGQVVSEITPQGAKERTFVHADGGLFAVQYVSVAGQSVQWEHYDTSGASYRSTNVNGVPVVQAERDPMGADAGLFKPFTWPEPTSSGKIEPFYGIPELNSATQGCTLDRVPIPCDIYNSLLNNDAVQVEYLVADVKKAPPKPREKGQPKPPPPATTLTFKKGDVRSLGLGILNFDSLTWNDEEGGWDLTEESFTPPNGEPFRLSNCLKWLLAPYFRGSGEFRGIDLDDIKIYEGLPENITQFAVIDVGAITLANSIYFAPGQYSANLDGIELVAHELTHIKQWRLKGQVGFVSAYLSEYLKNKEAGMSDVDAYANISLEKEAAEYAANIKQAIKNGYGESPCDKYKP
jgi:YD repeat-containing protein